MTTTKTETDDSGARGGEKLKLGWMAAYMLLTAGTVGYVQVNQIGPRIFWATNACPGNTVQGVVSSCGVMPLIIPIAAVSSALISTAVVDILQRVGGGN